MSFLSAEPRQTRLDLSLTVLRIPVRIHVSFWLIPLVALAYGRGSIRTAVLITLINLVTIGLHELGHAWAALWRGYRARVTLAWYGGVAVAAIRPNDLASRVAMIAAGPVANLLLGLFVLGLMAALQPWTGELTLTGTSLIAPGGWITTALRVLAAYNLALFVINCLPIYGMDGGQLARAAFCRYVQNGLIRFLWLSTAVSIVLAGACWIVELDILTRVVTTLLFVNSAYQLVRGRRGHYIP